METKVEKYPSFLEFASRYPPDGVQLRDLLNKAARSPLSMSGISDFERWKREIQGVKCQSVFSQDHSFDVVSRNYSKSLGAKCVWSECVCGECRDHLLHLLLTTSHGGWK